METLIGSVLRTTPGRQHGQQFNCEEEVVAEASADSRRSYKAGVTLPRCPEWRQEGKALFPLANSQWRGEASSFSQGQSLQRDAAVSLGSQRPSAGRRPSDLKVALGQAPQHPLHAHLPKRLVNPWKTEPTLKVWHCATHRVGV